MEQTGKRCIRYTELPDVTPGSVLADEWNTFRSELPRLLAEGHEGKFALIKGKQIVGTFDTWEAGYEAAWTGICCKDSSCSRSGARSHSSASEGTASDDGAPDLPLQRRRAHAGSADWTRRQYDRGAAR